MLFDITVIDVLNIILKELSLAKERKILLHLLFYTYEVIIILLIEQQLKGSSDHAQVYVGSFSVD